MKEALLREHYAQRGLGAEDTEDAISYVRELEKEAVQGGFSLDSVDVDTLKDYISRLVSEGRNTPERFLALARYAYLAGNIDLYLYLVGIIGGRGVIRSIAERTEHLAGAGVRATIFDAIQVPPLGSPQDSYPAATKAVVDRLQGQLPEDVCKEILAGNHHQVPVETFRPLREKYLQEGVDALLRYRHEKLVAELESHADSGRPWFEQIITREVVDFVRRDQEIAAGVRVEDTIYVSKIPYAPQEYLDENDPTMKRYYQCHCPLARASILGDTPAVPPLFCYCSGGFGKLPFEVAFDEPVEVEVLESALAGDVRCRFAIKIPEGALR